MMGRPKGGKNKRWSMEEKLRIVRRYFDERIGQNRLAAEEGISRGQVQSWISKYQKGGPESLKNMKKVGNRYSALHTSKSKERPTVLNADILSLGSHSYLPVFNSMTQLLVQHRDLSSPNSNTNNN